MEHVSNWRKGLQEISRVSQRVEITVPCVSHIAKNEWIFIIRGALNYVSQTKKGLKNESLGLKNLNYFMRLPERCREHLWQFDDKILKKELENMNFTHVNVETTRHNILRILKRKDFWRITAF